MSFSVALLLVVANGAGLSELRAKGHSEFEKGHYKAACPDLAEAGKLAPTDADLWAELAVCYEKLGDTKAAVAANGHAADWAGPTARLQLYRALAKEGVSITLPKEMGSKNCSNLPSSGMCEARVWACAYETYEGGSGGGQKIDGVVFCPSLPRASGAPVGWGRSKTFFKKQNSCPTMPLSVTDVNNCRPGDVGGAGCGACKCSDAPNPDKCAKAVEDCKNKTGSKTSHRCQVVFVDACRERIGAICDGEATELAAESP